MEGLLRGRNKNCKSVPWGPDSERNFFPFLSTQRGCFMMEARREQTTWRESKTKKKMKKAWLEFLLASCSSVLKTLHHCYHQRIKRWALKGVCDDGAKTSLSVSANLFCQMECKVKTFWLMARDSYQWDGTIWDWEEKAGKKNTNVFLEAWKQGMSDWAVYVEATNANS